MSEISKEDGAVKIKPGKEIIASTCADLRQELLAIINDGEKKIIIDLQDTQMIDSSGLGLLIATKNNLTEAGGGEVEIINISENLMQLFIIMRLENHFSLHRA